MAVLGVLDMEGITTDQYDSVVERMGVEGRALGSIYLHIAATTAEGIRVVEIWDDPQELEQFLANTLFPTMRELGIEQQHSLIMTPIHNVFVPRLQELPMLSRFAEQS
ncbi:hypothetical protein ABIA39_004222 [Nocardia sp. GAS34]|uniref:hypothetical protein n=1 Tax=unclassified Nocardia TaxID=2637762 RepID=UPI003D24B9F0